MVHPPSPLQLRRPPCGCTALELNSQRAHKRTGNRITRIVTRTEKFSVRVYRPSARDAYTSSESWTPHCCERPCWIRYSANAPHSPFFCTALDDDERTSVGRVSHCFLSSVCQNFLKCIRTKNRVIFLSQRRNFEVSKNLSFQIPFERMKILSRSWPRFTNRLWKRCDGSTYRTRNLSLSFIGR